MKLYLSQKLIAQRRGRFLASLLSAQPISGEGFPENGFLIMTGDTFQNDTDNQSKYTEWTHKPGCALLLLPPFNEGRICSSLDWECRYTQNQPVAISKKSVENCVAQEVLYELNGKDGSDDGLIWDNNLSHTRYWKFHSNSGLFAATVLPLWSISLLDHSTLVMNFLEQIYSHCGKVSTETIKDNRAQPELYPQDVTVLICCYGFGVVNSEDICKRISQNSIPLLKLDSFELQGSLERLSNAGYIDNDGLTTDGFDYLQASPYWMFAESLKGIEW